MNPRSHPTDTLMSTHSLVIPAKMHRVAELCDLVSQAAQEAGFDSKSVYSCELAVGEACENIIKHGYQGESKGNLDLTIRVEPGKIALTIEDTAPAFNPASAPQDQTWDEEDPPIGGLGLIIMHRAMDNVRYARHGNRNILRMQKAAG